MGFMCRVSVERAGVVGIEAGGKKGGGACIAFCYTSGRMDLLYFILQNGAAKNTADAHR